MEIPPEIAYRNVEKSAGLEELIREKAAKLDEIHDKLISCRIAVEKAQEQSSGSPYRVRIVLRVPPGKELVVAREPGEGQVNERLTTAVNSAFDAIRRQLIKLKEIQQGEVKTHPQQDLIGHVVRLFPRNDYGFIRSVEGRELFFHRNSVLNEDFDRLEIGTGVRYFPGEGDKGPQASTVQIVDKPGVRAAKVTDPRSEQPAGWKA
ncbi:MAG: HPF/RaiA family ribosome-associated protein [Desulfobacterales bacterium]